MTRTRGIQALRNSQRTIRGLFRQVEVVDRRAQEMKKGVVGEVFMMLEVHLDLEEEFIYPALKSSKKEEDREIACQGLQQNDEIRLLIRALRKRDPQEEHFYTGLTNLITTAEEHLTAETEKIFPAAEKVLGSLFEEMVPRIEERRQELISSPRYEGVRPDQVQYPYGGEQKRKKIA